jgi:hypothetical protein
MTGRGGDRKKSVARKVSRVFRRFTVFEKLVEIDRTRGTSGPEGCFCKRFPARTVHFAHFVYNCCSTV